MTKKKLTSIVDFPEEIDKESGIKVYGETSYENHIAVLSHYLHNSSDKISKKQKEEIIVAIREFLERKQSRQKISIEELFIRYMDLQSEASCATEQKLRDELQDLNQGDGLPLLFR